ncbi:MAG: hypothetical protein JJU05_01260 [Verrucomicrobia bacterium]|nr:hypothetical protein [Verrucomicrobiota bacterium]MCH8525888.1 hypothetical protein [Kiritimatiellia bacterium]
MRVWLLLLCLPLWAESLVLPPRLLTHGPEMELTLSATEFPHEALYWRFVFEGRTLSQGTVNLDETGRALLRFQTPPPREGLPLALELRLSLSRNEAPSQGHKVWVFPEDPWFGGKDRLKALPLWLYDPMGDTAAWMERHAIPFRRVRDFGEVSSGVLLIGEGLPFRRYPDLMGRLTEVSGSGISVLVLPPADGLLDLPASGADSPRPEIRFIGMTFLEELDPRLQGGGFSARYYNLEADRGRVWLKPGAGEGWPWVRFREKGGAPVLFCGVSLTSYEHDSPAPQLLLQALLHHVREASPKTTKTP